MGSLGFKSKAKMEQWVLWMFLLVSTANCGLIQRRSSGQGWDETETGTYRRSLDVDDARPGYDIEIEPPEIGDQDRAEKAPDKRFLDEETDKDYDIEIEPP